MAALGDVALVALVLLAHVDDLDGPVGQESLQLVERNGLQALVGVRAREVAG
jgi:hypothetical protein